MFLTSFDPDVISGERARVVVIFVLEVAEVVNMYSLFIINCSSF